MTPSPDLAIPRHLASHAPAPAAAVGIACRTTPADICACLAMLETMRFVAGRQGLDSKAPRRVYNPTAGGWRKAGIGGARSKV